MRQCQNSCFLKIYSTIKKFSVLQSLSNLQTLSKFVKFSVWQRLVFCHYQCLMEEETKVHEKQSSQNSMTSFLTLSKMLPENTSHARAMLTFLPWEPGTVINAQQIRKDFLKGKEKGLFRMVEKWEFWRLRDWNLKRKNKGLIEWYL